MEYEERGPAHWESGDPPRDEEDVKGPRFYRKCLRCGQEILKTGDCYTCPACGEAQ